MEYVALIVLGVLIGRFIGLYYEFKEYKKQLDKPQGKIQNIKETDLRDEVPYETVKQLVELTNLVNYDGSSKGQISLRPVNEFYGKDGD